MNLESEGDTASKRSQKISSNIIDQEKGLTQADFLTWSLSVPDSITAVLAKARSDPAWAAGTNPDLQIASIR